MAALKIFLIGTTASGKSSVFNALTNTPDGPNFTTKGGHKLGTVKVPDARLAQLRDLFNPKKYTPAEITFVDVAVPASADSGKTFSQLNAFLSDADAFGVVVQCFGEYDGQGRPLDSAANLESILLDLAMADLEIIERRLERIEKEKNRPGKDCTAEKKVLEKCKAHIEEGGHIRELELTDDELNQISCFRFLSQKDVLIIANVSEDAIQGEGLDALKEKVEAMKMTMITFCAPLESEIAGLPADEQNEFLSDYGLTEPARVRLIQYAYKTLNLISFFTAGDDEVKAWTIHDGDIAHKAAGKIHSDIERGFIRAETVDCQSLLDAGSIGACREKGLFRLEGKNYIVQDADVIDFKFSV